MELSLIDPSWPNALRWFLAQGLNSFTPWHFIVRPDEMDFAAKAFEREDMGRRKVFTFASRQDCDDFAGLEIVDGKVTDTVLYFHPVFNIGASLSLDWDIVIDSYPDVFDFVSRRVIPAMKDWATVEDASDL